MNSNDNSTSSLSARPAQDTRPAEAEREPDRLREAPPKEQVDRFRQLMQHGRQEARPGPQERLAQARDALAEAARRDGAHAARSGGADAPPVALQERQGSHEGTDHHGMGANALEGAELLAMMQAQSALREAATAPPPAAPPAPSGKALAEMLERHVRQLAVDGAASTDGEGHVLLRMSDATLPGTDLLLSRTADGWHLRADVRSRDSFDAIREAAPALARRFAEHNLGRLEIDPRFDG